MGNDTFNSLQYWEERFSSGSWDAYDGEAQSEFFARLALTALPGWMKELLQKNAWSVTDLGCAEGGGTAALARHFPNCRFTGVDFSAAALDAARKNYPFCDFRAGDLRTWDEPCDVVFSSNTLEHMRAPREIMERMVRCAARHVILLLPLRDVTENPEHFFVFDEGFFPLELSGFVLTYFREIDCAVRETPYWPGEQILLIYSAPAELGKDRTIKDLYSNEEYGSIKAKWLESRAAAEALKADKEELGQKLELSREAHRRAEAALTESLSGAEKLRQELTETQDQRDLLAKDRDRSLARLSETEDQRDRALELLEEREARIADLERASETARSDLEEKDRLLAARDRALQEKEELLAKKEELVRRSTDALEEKTRATELQSEKINALSAALEHQDGLRSRLAAQVRELSGHKIFRLAHFLNRLHWQLIKGRRTERRAFWKWLFGHFAGKVSEDHRYNPLFGVIEKLETSPAYSLPERAQEPVIPVPDLLPDALTGDYTHRDILVFSVIDYDFRFQRPQHFADGFAARGHRVFYFNANFFDGAEPRVERRKENLFLVTLPNRIHSAVYSTAFQDDGADICPLLDTVMDEYAIRDAMIVCGYPTWHNPVRYLRTKYGFPLVTDYMDDYTGFDNVEESFVERECVLLLEHSDLVIASSTYLSERASAYNGNVAVIRNGTEYAHFHRAFREHGEDGKKVIGYYGAIAHWFDYRKIQQLSKDYPQAEIVLIGAVTCGEEILKGLPNVRLPGEKKYEELPELLAEFDVCLIPFETSTDLIKATNPVKFYEYLSAGKKIVATEIPELEPYRDEFVYMADDDELFSHYVGLCLQGEDTLADSRRAMAFARENDWDARTERFLTLTDPIYPSVSVIVLCYNQLDYTKKCVESILRDTAWPNYEIVLVDNASSDGTADWIREISRREPRIVPVINGVNRGFAGGNNDGIRASSGEYIVLLNNDTVVTRGWLTGLVKHCRRNGDRAIVGPVTNSIGNEAMILLDYSDLEEMAPAAMTYTSAHMGETYPHVDVLAMFCVLFPRELTNRIGLLDENYGIGMFEDDDYSAAALNAGYSLVLAEDVFIHHFGSASFSKLTDEVHRELFERNKAYYEKKWNTVWKMHQYRPSVNAANRANGDRA